jgi:hypothetical protein
MLRVVAHYIKSNEKGIHNSRHLGYWSCAVIHVMDAHSDALLAGLDAIA